jgi:hypothetical protein
MVCRVIKGDGVAAIVCGPRERKRRCSCCGRPASLLCDHPAGRNKTCDKPLCPTCAVEVGPDRHHCPHHPQGAFAL